MLTATRSETLEVMVRHLNGVTRSAERGHRARRKEDRTQMDFSSKLDTLQQHVTKTKTDADAAVRESHDRVQQRIDQAQADVDNQAREAKASAQSKWAQMKADQHSRMQDLRTRIEHGNAQLDAAAADANADWAESDAADAIDFAAWAIDNARVSLLYAISTRVNATERAAMARN
jgi:hypothetical protein